MPFTTSALIIAGSTAASAGMGMASSSKAASQQEKAMAQEAAAREKDLAFRQKMYADEKAFYDPMREQIRNMALSDKPLGYDRNAGEIKKQYSDAMRNLTSGASFNSGLAGGAGRQAMFGQAQDLTKAYDEGVMKRMALLQGIGMGGNQLQYGMNVSGGMENMASMYGNNASMYGNLAAAGSAAAGQAISSGMSALGSMYGQGGFGQNNYIDSRFSPIVDAGGWSSLPTSNIGNITLPPVPGVVK